MEKIRISTLTEKFQCRSRKQGGSSFCTEFNPAARGRGLLVARCLKFRLERTRVCRIALDTKGRWSLFASKLRLVCPFSPQSHFNFMFFHSNSAWIYNVPVLGEGCSFQWLGIKHAGAPPPVSYIQVREVWLSATIALAPSYQTFPSQKASDSQNFSARVRQMRDDGADRQA